MFVKIRQSSKYRRKTILEAPGVFRRVWGREEGLNLKFRCPRIAKTLKYRKNCIKL